MRSAQPALLLAALLGLPVSASAETTVTLWHAYRGKESEALGKVADAFNAKKSGVTLKLVAIPYDAFADKITAAVPHGKGPDLFIFAQDRIGDWAAGGLIEPVDFWLDDALKGSFLPPTLEALSYDDAVYGLPLAFKTVALYYNTKLVKAPPATTDELVEQAKKLTDPKAGKYGLVYENANFYHHAAWMQGFGARVFDKKKPTLDSPQAIEALAFARGLAKDAGIMPEEVTATLVTTLFNKGQAAFVINGPWFMAEIDKGVPYKVAVLPSIGKTGKKAAPFLTTEAVIMSAKTADKKAAFEVMKHLASVEAGKIMATIGKQPSAQKAVYSDAAVTKDPLLMTFKAQLESAVPMPNTPAMRMVWSPATSAMNKVINGKIAPDVALHEAQAEIEKLVKR